jgi:lipid kinase YegS
MNDSPSGASVKVALIIREEIAAEPFVREAIETIAAEFDCDVETCVATDAEDTRRFAREWASEPIKAIVAGGGDGSLNQAAAGFLECEKPQAGGLAVAPLGTANDFAGMLGLESRDLLEALRWAVQGDATLIDAGKMNDRVFVNVATGGHAAKATTEANPVLKDALGRFAYMWSGIKSVANIEPVEVKLRGSGDFSWEGPLYGLCAGNGRQTGGGMRVCHNALLNDGQLDVTVFPEMPLTQVAEVAALLHGDYSREERGAALGQYNLARARVEWLEVEAASDLQINLDGEPINGTRFRFETIARRLPFYLPPNAPLVENAETQPN